MLKLNWRITTLCCCLAIASCSSSDNSTQVSGPVATDEPFEGLRVIGDKERFSTSIKAALLNSLDGGGSEQFPTTADSPANPAAPAPVASPEAAPAADSDSSGSGDTPLQVTETNVQEAGVDEADRIKSDGRFLYVLNTANGDFAVPEGEPVPAPAPFDSNEQADSLTNRTSIPYEPFGKAQVKVLSLDHDAADAQLLTTVQIDTANQRADGLYLYQTDTDKSLIVTTSSMSGYWDYWGYPYEFLGEKSTVHKLDISDPATTNVSDSLTLDGQIVSSRRIGDYLYVASRFFPWLDGLGPYPEDTQASQQAINDAPVEDLLPKATRLSDSSVQPMADAANCFVAAKPQNGYYSPDIVTLAVIDLRTLSVTGSVCYLGASEHCTHRQMRSILQQRNGITPILLIPVSILYLHQSLLQTKIRPLLQRKHRLRLRNRESRLQFISSISKVVA